MIKMFEKVKLIIWDLDQTFWIGTLDEGPVTPVKENIELLRKLNEHGVVNSICSKNNYDRAKSALQDMEVWDEFTMSQISWMPKGESVKQIIQDFQLRTENVVFIDDHELNLHEVLFYNPGIILLNPTKEKLGIPLNKIIENNKQDDRKRFAEYKVLQEKLEVKKTYSSNDLFLRESGIKIYIEKKCLPDIQRIQELINRTNQLNYTKRRISSNELLSLLNSSNDNFTVHVSDKFGNYGLVGFGSYNKERNEFDQFVFSCRTLNMGIEQFIWTKYSCPEIKISGEVATPLLKNAKIDWIAEVSADDKPGAVRDHSGKRNKILMIGGCDVEQLFHYLISDKGIDYYFNYPSGKYGIAAHRDGIQYLYGSMNFSEEGKKIIYETVPFTEPKYYSLPDLNRYDVIIYSALIDYVQCVYVNKIDSSLAVSFGDFTDSIKGGWDSERQSLLKLGMPEDKIRLFADNWESVGAIEPDAYEYKLNSIFGDFRGELLLIGGVENKYPLEDAKYVSHHITLNSVLRSFAQKRKALTVFLDMDELINSNDDFTDALRHYKREVYLRMAEKIIRIVPTFRKKPKYREAIDRILKRGIQLFSVK